MIIIINVAISIGYAIACIFGKASLALAILPIFVVPLLAFGGFYINVSSLPPYFYPLKYLSYFAYGFETVAINEWSRVDQIGGCLTTTNTTQCYRTGEDVLHSLSFDENNLYWNLLWSFVMIVVVRIIAFLALFTHANLKK
uniref:ABC-2 type transporter transmembrane domain-containing protein n=1 Tax=Acrobeloides nanus TaxID=290746 RepID=A0A914EFE0_9BILA